MINAAVGRANSAFSPINIEFIVVLKRYHNDDNYVNLQESQMANLFNTYNVYADKALNLYFTPNPYYTGSSSYPDSRANLLGIPNLPPGIVMAMAVQIAPQ